MNGSGGSAVCDGWMRDERYLGGYLSIYINSDKL